MTYSMNRPKATRHRHYLDAHTHPGEGATPLQVMAAGCEPLLKSNHWPLPLLTGRRSLLVWTNWNGGTAEGVSGGMDTLHVQFEGDLWRDRVGAWNHQL